MGTGGQRGAPGKGAGPGSGRRAVASEARRRQERKRALRKRIILAGIGLVVVVFLFQRATGGRKAASELASALTAGSCKVDQKTDAGDKHVPNTTYKVNPPAGGEHSVAVSPVVVVEPDGEVPPDPPLVHALEHGYVIIWYQPDIGDSQFEALAKVAEKRERDVLIVPRSSLSVPVAATAWHQRVLCDEVEAEPLAKFIDAYRNKGPEKIEH
ncbi:MAG: DUF3105 domain-containing protein [Acidimicrobiia bacterium]